MTPAEQYANSLVDLPAFPDPMLLPRWSAAIAAGWGILGGIAGGLIGAPWGAGAGFVLGGVGGLFAYHAVETYACDRCINGKRSSLDEERVIRSFIALRGNNSPVLSLEELYLMRRACM